MLPPSSSEAEAHNRLAHARLSYALVEAGVDHLFIKGVTTADLLESSRVSGDVDVLVPGKQLDAATEVAESLGYQNAFELAAPSEQTQHARTFESPHGVTFDIHVHFPGLEADPDSVWAQLRSRSTDLLVAGRYIAVPDAVSRGLLLALTAARDGRGSRAASDLAAAMERVDLRELRALATGLQAMPQLRAGLESLDEPAGLVKALDLAHVEPAPHWQLLAKGLTSEQQTWVRIQEASMGRRLALIARELWPSRAFMQYVAPETAGSRIQLLRARWLRLRRLAQTAPRVIREVAARRREP